MKKQYFIFSFLLFLLLISSNIFSQVTFEATVGNQSVSGTDFYFDIYIKRTGSNDLYLGNAQFILSFNNGAFTNPILSLAPDDATYFNLLNSNSASCGSWYYQITATALTGNQLQISLNQVTFSTQDQFNSRVAKIDNQASTHRIGRYKVSGITNSAASMNLQWLSSGEPHSKVFTLANSDPWTSTEATGTWTNPSNQPLPVEINSFTTKEVKEGRVTLIWETSTEVNNYGFDVERKMKNESWEKIGFVQGNGNSNSQKSYSFLDEAVLTAGKYYYRLKQIDTDGKYEYSKEIEVIVNAIPNKFSLSQNYPNPFNPSTTIKYQLPKPIIVDLKIFDMLGREVETLINETKDAGVYEIEFNGSKLSSGIYFYKIRAGEFSAMKKFIIVK